MGQVVQLLKQRGVQTVVVAGFGVGRAPHVCVVREEESTNLATRDACTYTRNRAWAGGYTSLRTLSPTTERLTPPPLATRHTPNSARRSSPPPAPPATPPRSRCSHTRWRSCPRSRSHSPSRNSHCSRYSRHPPTPCPHSLAPASAVHSRSPAARSNSISSPARGTIATAAPASPPARSGGTGC